MKDQTKKYSTKIGNAEYEFTAHSTKEGARNSIHEAHNPCLVQLPDGWFDSFPAGHPLPAGAVLIERYTFGKWARIVVASEAYDQK